MATIPLFLGPGDSPVLDFLRQHHSKVHQTSDPIDVDNPLVSESNFLVSYGYRFIVSPDVLARFPNSAINLHISYLPWNRGADPNLWSFLNGTPKGVTIHVMDRGLDTGDILVQRRLDFGEGETLRSSYQLLCAAIEALFYEHWNKISTNAIKPRPQVGEGSSHCSKDKEAYLPLLASGWDTPVDAIIGKGGLIGKN